SNQFYDRRFDPKARAQLRKIVGDSMGLLKLFILLENQRAYLQPENTGAAFDNELALLWWNFYLRNYGFPTFLHSNSRATPAAPQLMVMRLDAPEPSQVQEMIQASLKAERDGLKGKIVLDSRGIPPLNADGTPHGYYSMDQRIRNLAEIIRTRTKLQ